MMRSLDPETAARLLGQLSPDEAAALREAVRALGPVDAEEQADVAAEFRRTRGSGSDQPAGGVELMLSSHSDPPDTVPAGEPPPLETSGKRFEFLANAPIKSFVSCLAREHAQTIAVVLSHLPPSRAADVLAGLPPKIQADAIERLSMLGEMDAESVAAVERELAAWFGKHRGIGPNRGRQSDVIAAILTAADTHARSSILAALKSRNAAAAETISRGLVDKTEPRGTAQAPRRPHAPRSTTAAQASRAVQRRRTWDTVRLLPEQRPQPAPELRFDQLIHLDDRTLSSVLHDVNSNAMALALVGSTDELLDRVCDQMPKRTAKQFRRKLAQLGPTRLSDVEAAQHLVARVAGQKLARPGAALAHAG